MQKKYATGRPDQKDLNENLAATQGLAHMIVECNRLFEVEEPVDEITQDLACRVQDLQPPPRCVRPLSVSRHAFVHPLDPPRDGYPVAQLICGGRLARTHA